MEDASATICTAIVLLAVGVLLLRKTYKGLDLSTKSKEHEDDIIMDVPQIIKKKSRKRNRPGRHKAMVVRELLASYQNLEDDEEDLPVECMKLKKV